MKIYTSPDFVKIDIDTNNAFAASGGDTCYPQVYVNGSGAPVLPCGDDIPGSHMNTSNTSYVPGDNCWIYPPSA